MGKVLRASVLMLLLGSCGGGNYSAPRQLDDACAIVRERPTYLRAMKAREHTDVAIAQAWVRVQEASRRRDEFLTDAPSHEHERHSRHG